MFSRQGLGDGCTAVKKTCHRPRMLRRAGDWSHMCMSQTPERGAIRHSLSTRPSAPSPEKSRLWSLML